MKKNIYFLSELEKMATDEKYASEKMHSIKTIIDMSKKICEKFVFKRAGGEAGQNDTIINKIGISINEDGSVSIFAELEKMTEKQKEYLEKLSEKRAEEKKEAEQSEEKKIHSYKKGDEASVKKVVVEASSEDELLEKICNVDWEKVAGEIIGARFDFSV